MSDKPLPAGRDMQEAVPVLVCQHFLKVFTTKS